MQPRNIGKPTKVTPNPLEKMFLRIIQRQAENLPVLADKGHSPAVSKPKEKPLLKLADSRTILVDSQPVGLPLGIGNSCTGTAIKELAGVYRGRVLFIQEGQRWRRVQDHEVVALAHQQSYRTEKPAVFRSSPQLTVD